MDGKSKTPFMDNDRRVKRLRTEANLQRSVSVISTIAGVAIASRIEHRTTRYATIVATASLGVYQQLDGFVKKEIVEHPEMINVSNREPRFILTTATALSPVLLGLVGKMLDSLITEEV